MKMSKSENIDLMSLLLSEEVTDNIEELQQLNDIIFCDTENLPMNGTEQNKGKLIWQTDNDKFAIHVWKIKGKVSLKFIPKPNSDCSVERLAKVALKAILEDLEKAKL